MLLTRTDKETLMQLVDGHAPGENGSNRNIENFSFFTEQIAKADLGDVWKQ